MVLDFSVQASMGKVSFFALILSSLPQIKVYLNIKKQEFIWHAFRFLFFTWLRHTTKYKRKNNNGRNKKGSL